MWVDFPILNPYSSHMALPMWVQRGTMLQIPHESLMGCPYRTHINTHLWPMWVLYLLLAGKLPRTRYLTPHPFLFREEWFMVHFMIIHLTVLNRKVYSVTNYFLEWSLPGFLA